MADRDDILARIDDTLARIDDTLLNGADLEWDAVSGPTESAHRRPESSIASMVAAHAQRAADREQAVARLAAVTNPTYASDMRWTTGGDVRQLETITRLHVAHGFDVNSQIMVREALEVGIDPNLFARGGVVRQPLINSTLPEPRPNLRLQVIDALGLMPLLTRLVTWLSAALVRIRPVLDRVDLRPTARRRRRDARQPVRTITVTLDIDTTAFSEAMRRVGVTAADGGANLSAFMRWYATWELHQIDLDGIRSVGRAQLREARAWLDQHVDDVYADLQLTRTTSKEN